MSQANEMEVVTPGALESIARAETDMAINTARRYPRQPAVVKSKMLSIATMDVETAEACFYTLPRGGKKIQGPSVRLAEIAVSSYGNLQIATRVISVDSTSAAPHVVVQAVCRDLENNISVSIEKRRRIVGKRSNQGRIDEDDINLSANSGSAIAFRDAVFKIVPLAMIKPVFEKCREVAIGDAKTLKDRIATMVARFGKMNVNEKRLLAYLEKATLEEITIDDIQDLIGVFNAIKEGDTSIDDSFPPEAKTGTAAAAPAPGPAAAAATGAKTAEKAPEKQPEKKAETKQPEPAKEPAKAEEKKDEKQEAKAEAKADKANVVDGTQTGGVKVEQPPETPAPPADATTAQTEAPKETPAPAEQCPEADPEDRMKIARAVKTRAEKNGVAEKQVVRYLQSLTPPLARGSQNEIAELADMKLSTKVWPLFDDPAAVEAMKKMKKD